MFNYFVRDIKRLIHFIESGSINKKNIRLRIIQNIFLNPSVYLISFFRLSSFLKKHHVPIFPHLLHFIESLIFCSSIHPSSKIGPGLLIPHSFCIVISGKVEVGKNCTIFHEVTIGGIGKDKDGAAKIGDNVTIYTGAKILGPIKIGDNARIGANSVVLDSVPDNSLAVGSPARIIQKNDN